jgi:hypothetical protein
VIEDAPWKDMHCELLPSSLHAMGPKKYVRSSALGPNLDIKTYDAGTLFVATTDGASGSPPWGKLWVEYDVTFSVPQTSTTGLASYIHLMSNITPPSSSSILPAPTLVAGSLPISAVGNNLTFPIAGTYFVNYNVQTTTSATQTTVPAASSGASLVYTYGDDSGSQEAGSGTAYMIQNTIIQTTLPNQSLVFNNTLVGGQYSELVVFLLPNGAI